MIEQSSSADSHPSTSSAIRGSERVAALGVQPKLLLLLASTLVLATLGQYNLQQKYLATREFPWEGLLIYVLAVVMFTAANVLADRTFDPVIQRDQPPASDQATVLPVRKPWRIIAVVLSLMLTAVALFFLGQDPPLSDYNWVAWPWLAAMILYLAPSRCHAVPSCPLASLPGGMIALWCGHWSGFSWLRLRCGSGVWVRFRPLLVAMKGHRAWKQCVSSRVRFAIPLPRAGSVCQP